MTLRTVMTLLVLSIATAARAQGDRRAAIGAGVFATNMDSRTSWSFAASFEYRLTRVAGLEIDATVVPTIESDFSFPTLASSAFFTSSLPSVPSRDVTLPPFFPQPRFANQRGRAVMFTNNVRVHIPTTTDRFDPYFVAGGGIASVRVAADYIYAPLVFEVIPGTSIPTGSLPIRTISEPFRSSSTSLALTIGGGVGVRVASGLWIEGDLRLFRLLGAEDQNVGRFGAGVRYRF